MLNCAPEKGEIFHFQAGQFVMLHILNPDGTTWRAKAYSICTPPSEKSYLELAIKIAGPFTQRAAALREGDTVELDGPHGAFTLSEPKDRDAAFLAGGIGITPFYSIIREATAQRSDLKITLLYANVAKEDIAFLSEILQLTRDNPKFSICFLVEQGEMPPPPATTERGRVTIDILKKYCGNFSSTDYYLCGPPVFMDVMHKLLSGQGVPEENIRKEHF
ncbi:MAG: FAD-dependent oxidoreductase [bacterium]